MDLEELKVIWDEQTKVPRFALNEADLHAIVQRRIEESNRSAAFRYRVEISLSAVLGIGLLIVAGILAFGHAEWFAPLRWPKRAPSSGDITALFLVGAIWVYFAFYLNRARLRLQRSGETFESSLRGDIDRSLARLEFQIKIAKDIVWWGFIPVYAAVTLWTFVLFKLSAGPARAAVLNTSFAVAFAGMVVAFALEVFSRQKAIRERYEPQRRELESLRRKLADPQR